MSDTDHTYSLARLQKEVEQWADYNFGSRPSWQPLLGAMEELGELAHVHLKRTQQIRGITLEESVLKKLDAIGDVIIYLADYCNREYLDLEVAVYMTWLNVKKRDWKRDPLEGTQNVDSTEGS